MDEGRKIGFVKVAVDDDHTGAIVGSLGGGALAALLAKMYRDSNDEKKHTWWNDPLIAGLLGAAGGYGVGSWADKNEGGGAKKHQNLIGDGIDLVAEHYQDPSTLAKAVVTGGAGLGSYKLIRSATGGKLQLPQGKASWTKGGIGAALALLAATEALR